MSIDLTSHTGAALNLRGSAWGFILNLAEAYGWKPAGTIPPASVDANEWLGGYDTSDGQTVTTQDALALSAALRRAHADTQRATTESRISRELADAVRTVMQRDHGITLPPDYGDEEWHLDEPFLAELCAFCDLGSFAID